MREWVYRQEQGADLRAMLERFLPEESRGEALFRLELYLDAAVYALRATSWLKVAGDTFGPTIGVPEYEQAAFRYRQGASLRMIRRYVDLRPYIERARPGHDREAWLRRIQAAIAQTGS